MTMSLMHQWHDTICGGVIGLRRSVWMHPRAKCCKSGIRARLRPVEPWLRPVEPRTCKKKKLVIRIELFKLCMIVDSRLFGVLILVIISNLDSIGTVWMHPRVYSCIMFRHLNRARGIPLLFLILIHLIRISYDIRLAERDVTYIGSQHFGNHFA
nr:hypothetical protein [Tanacetum cinerariifolium]